MVTTKEYPVRWKRPQIDLKKLAYLREVEGLNLRQLGAIFNRSPITLGQILKRLQVAKKGGDQ